MHTIYGIGNPLLDLTIEASHEALSATGAQPGSMNLVDAAQQATITALGEPRRAVPGGSCANSMRVAAWLASGEDPRSPTVAYGGAVGTDAFGTTFDRALRSEGVVPRIASVDAPTGTSAIVVTPDGERTMFTHLGACQEFRRDHVATDLMGRGAIFHLAGYMWDTDGQRDAARFALGAAREAGATVSFDVADTFVVDRAGDQFASFLPGKVDILFANRDELIRLTGVEGSDGEIAAAGNRYAPTVLMKVGARGCWIAEREAEPVLVPGVAVEVVDTTGAGDAFAGAYLFAAARGATPYDAVVLANGVAAGIVTRYGCSYEGLARPSRIG